VAPGDVVVVSGPPAAGKTTVARMLAARRSPAVHLHADDFWGFIVSGYVEPWTAAALEQNDVVMGAVCQSAFEFAVGGYCVVLDGVLGPWFVPELIRRCPPGELDVSYLMLHPTREQLVANLSGRTGHGFTSVDAALKMYDEFVAAVAGFERHVVRTAGMSAQQTLEQVEASLASGGLLLAGG
jgi:predicted kinase